ncbi:TetR/AcrR family transcriptional regulator [Solicola sp. PLA-1-18]|uniref:TetR/AcrR family transcriptional regulator n=1 Tax=Solicola sp. PLA-1-18 TaxID=3380532 RepID=UPI003B7715C9
MGLRAKNAERTRELLLDAALGLFVEQSFEETTLEQIAEKADVSLSTLYRYFPTKDLLVLAPVALHGQMADELASRPSDEPMAVALGHAVCALTGAQRGDERRLFQVSQLLARSEVLRSRLRDELTRERIALQAAIAHRLGRPESDTYCAMTARVTVGVFEVAAARARTGGTPFDGGALTEAAGTVMTALQADPPTMPRTV